MKYLNIYISTNEIATKCYYNVTKLLQFNLPTETPWNTQDSFSNVSGDYPFDYMTKSFVNWSMDIVHQYTKSLGHNQSLYVIEKWIVDVGAWQKLDTQSYWWELQWFAGPRQTGLEPIH